MQPTQYIVVMDNASIHHSDGVYDVISDSGALLIYLPPYSSDYNPIEELFSKLKAVVKRYEQKRGSWWQGWRNGNRKYYTCLVGPYHCNRLSVPDF